MPIFSRTLARITEPAVGASTCASGSQVWKGHIGTLTAKPRKNAQKTHHCSHGRQGGSHQVEDVETSKPETG